MKRKKALPVIPREPVRIVVLGLDGAGKSSILACISGQDVGSVTKTTGFVMKEMPFAGTSATIVDIGGMSSAIPVNFLKIDRICSTPAVLEPILQTA